MKEIVDDYVLYKTNEKSVTEMNLLWIIFISVAISSQNHIASKDTSELVAVAALFRHGDRSPITGWPNDPFFDEKYWPNGIAQLTQNGIRRAHSLGEWLRKRYNNFLNRTYTSKEIYVYSTDFDRTLMTSQAVLNGLYPPRDFQIWNENIPWQPIPVHSSQKHKDDIILDKRQCPKYKKLLKIAKQETYPKINEQYEDMMNYIQKYTGHSTVGVEEVWDFRSQLYVYENYNESFVPKWSKKLYPNADVTYVSNIPLQLLSSTKTMARLKVGPFFHKIFSHFDNFTCASPSSKTGPKFLAIAGHDSSLISIMTAMGVYDFRNIGFTDTLIWELRKSAKGNFFVNLLYKHQDNDNKELDKLQIGDCGIDCDYLMFKNIMSEITTNINDWEQECFEEVKLRRPGPSMNH